jgi:hypothetical protein
VTLLSLEIIDTSEIDFLFPQVSLQMSSNTCEMLEDLEQVDKPKKKKKSNVVDDTTDFYLDKRLKPSA